MLWWFSNLSVIKVFFSFSLIGELFVVIVIVIIFNLGCWIVYISVKVLLILGL